MDILIQTQQLKDKIRQAGCYPTNPSNRTTRARLSCQIKLMKNQLKKLQEFEKQQRESVIAKSECVDKEKIFKF